MSLIEDVSDTVKDLMARTLPVSTREQLQDIDLLLQRTIADIRQSINDQCALAHSERHFALRATPDELLSCVFLHLQDHPGDEDNPDPSWVSVLRVCRRWHRVAIGTPRLWRDLDFGRMPIEATLQYIHRRKSLPFFAWAPTLDSVSSLAAIYPSLSHQLCRLVLQAPPDLYWLLPVNLPNLEELWMSSFTSDVTEDPTSTSLSGFARLRVIKVTGLTPSWNEKPFPPSVQELSLDVTDLLWCPSSSQLRDCLEDLSNLRSFSLTGDRLIHSPNVDRLVLPAINFIYVMLPYQDLYDIVRILPVQHYRPYSLFLRGPRIQRRTDDTGLHSLFYHTLRPVVQPRSLPYTSIHISRNGNLRSFTLRDACGLELSSPSSRTSSTLHPLLDMVNVVQIKDVYLEDVRGPSIPTGLLLHDVVPFLSNATSLTIQRRVGVEAMAILVGLGEPDGSRISPSSEIYTVKWPHLKSITLENVRYNMIHRTSAPAITQLGQVLMALCNVAPGFQKLNIIGCSIEEEHIHWWRDFVPDIEFDGAGEFLNSNIICAEC